MAAAVFLVTGPSGAGKTTVARLLAAQFPRGVHLEVDVFRRSIVSGREEMTPHPSPEAVAQLRLRYRLGAAATDAYIAEGFTVVLDDVVAGELLEEVIGLIRSRPLHVVVLLPRKDVVAARDGARATTGYDRWSVDGLYDGFANETPRVGLWLDTSEQAPDETVREILVRT